MINERDGIVVIQGRRNCTQSDFTPQSASLLAVVRLWFRLIDNPTRRAKSCGCSRTLEVPTEDLIAIIKTLQKKGDLFGEVVFGDSVCHRMVDAVTLGKIFRCFSEFDDKSEGMDLRSMNGTSEALNLERIDAPTPVARRADLSNRRVEPGFADLLKMEPVSQNGWVLLTRSQTNLLR